MSLTMEGNTTLTAHYGGNSSTSSALVLFSHLNRFSRSEQYIEFDGRFYDDLRVDQDDKRNIDGPDHDDTSAHVYSCNSHNNDID
jgi:hypothetical protein